MTRELKSKLIKVMFAITAIFLLFTTVNFFAWKPMKASADDSEKTIDLYVIAGQSNAAGYTLNPSNTTFNSDVDYYAVAGTESNQISVSFDKVAYGKGSKSTEHFGPEIGIANAIATSGRTNKAVIYKYAIGGTYLYPIAGRDTWANALYNNWQKHLSVVVKHYTDLGYTVNLMGTFWMQGEADSEQPDYYNAYAANLTALINNMRNDYAALKVENVYAPFVIGKIADNYGNMETTAGVAAIREAQDNVAKNLADKNVYAIETEKVATTGGDNYHFGTEDMQDVGLRAGKTMIANNNFVMSYGASIRKTDPTGIRFSATLSASKYAEIVENGAYKNGYKVGMIIVPAQYFEDFKAQSEVTDYYSYFKTIKGKMIDLPYGIDDFVALDNGDYKINGAIVNIKEANFALDYQAVAYIAKTDESGTAYEYSNVSESRNVNYVAKKAIESGELSSDEAKLLCETYNLTYSDISVTAEGETYMFRTIGVVTLQEVSNLIYSQYGKKIVEFEGKSLTDIISGTAEGNVVALNGYVGAFVTVKVDGEVTQTIAAKKETGLSEAIAEPSGLWMYEIKRDGTKIDSLESVDFTALTEDTTISFEYVKANATVSGDEVTIAKVNGQDGYAYLAGSGSAVYLKAKLNITGSHQGIVIYTGDDPSKNNATIGFQHKGYAIRQGYTWQVTLLGDVFNKSNNLLGIIITDDTNKVYPGEVEVEYFIIEGKLYVIYDGTNLFSKPLTLSELNSAFTADASYHIGLSAYEQTTTHTALEVAFGATATNKYNCACDKHVDNNGDFECDYCKKELPKTVNVTFDYSAIGGSTETIVATYGEGLAKQPTVPESKWAITCNYSGDYKGLTKDLTVKYSYVSEKATISGDDVTTKQAGGDGYAYLAGSGSAVYLKAKLNITDDHSGIVIYTGDDPSQNNVSIGFQHNGYSLRKNYTWAAVLSGDNAVFQKNGILGIATANKGEHTVEYFIIEGKLYVIYDGTNLFSKPLTLSELNAAYTADANYHIGLMAYNTVTTHTALEVAFGDEATNKYNCASDKHVDNNGDFECDYCKKELPKTVNVTFDYSAIGGSTETIVATYGEGLAKQPTVPESKWAITCNYTGDYKDLTEDLTVNYSYVSEKATISGDDVTTKQAGGDGYAYLAGSGSAVYLKAKLNITGDHSGIVIYTGDDPSQNNVSIGFQHNGYSLRKNYTWAAVLSGDNAVFQKNGILGIATANKGEHTVEYFIIEGKLYVIYDGTNLFSKPLTLSELNAAYTADANYHIGLMAYNTATTHTALEVAFGDEATNKYNCASDKHVDNNGDFKCDYCKKELPKTVNVTFDYSAIGGSTETIVATYGEGLANTPNVPQSKWAIKCDYTGDYKDLAKDLTVKYSYVSASATVSGDDANIAKVSGQDGYAYLAGSGSAVYLKAKLNITGDHQGIVIYTGDDYTKNNVTIGFQHQGYAIRKNYTWAAVLSGDNAVFQKNGILGIATANKGEHTVEYFIIEGKLYVIYDGTNLFDKPLTLSELNSAYTADASYHIGLSSYGQTTTHTALEVAFGDDAIAKYDEAVTPKNA